MRVVYLYIPTPNHNSCCSIPSQDSLYIFIFLHQTTTQDKQFHHLQPLYIFIFLHQTTTPTPWKQLARWLYIFIFLHQTTTDTSLYGLDRLLYIFIFLHQTTTIMMLEPHHFLLYIFIFLHQTTTIPSTSISNVCCISLYSYIKPQPIRPKGRLNPVVYLYIPTSNHNSTTRYLFMIKLYIFIFLHQTTTKQFS